jgi:hypothetical protein
MLSKLVDKFNKNRGRKVAASVIKLLDESMSAWRPRKNKTGGCSETGIMLYLEIQRGKAEMPKWSAMYRELGATSSCSVRAAKEMANGGQRKTEHRRNCILGDSWFASVKTAEAIHECGHEWIGIVKTSHSLFPKKELEDKMKIWPGGMNLAMEATTSKGVKLLAIGYKYNSSKLLCFVATKNAGSTMLDDP